MVIDVDKIPREGLSVSRDFEFLNVDLVEENTVILAPAHAAEAWRRRTEGAELLHAISMLELLSFTGERLLRDTDVASMAVGLAARLAGRVYWDVLGVAPPQVRWAKVADAVRAARDPLGLYQVLYALFTRDTQGVLATGAVNEMPVDEGPNKTRWITTVLVRPRPATVSRTSQRVSSPN